MRIPEDMARAPRPRGTRRQLILVVAIVFIIILILSLRGISVFYTDYLWFRSVALTMVWKNILLTKIALAAVFVAIFFVLSLVSVSIADRMVTLDEQPNDDLVKRYRQAKHRFPRLGRILICLVAALIVGSGVSAEWNTWLLFSHSVPFHIKDPLFHLDYSFYVFRLPFELFLVSWSFLSLTIIFILTTAVHYLNGNIRTAGRSPRVSPRVKAHMSVILALMALVKAVGYYLQRYQLTLSTRGYVEGAAYTDVHAQLPALSLLIFISVLSCILFIVNIRMRGWVFPVIGLGLWLSLSVILGAIYPAIIQQFFVQPAQATKELPYIARNITATRFGMGIQSVEQLTYNVNDNITATQLLSETLALQGVGINDPTIALPTFDKLQDVRSYYQFNSLASDRYMINGVETPVILGVRELNNTSLPSQSWINLHLQYTHGYGVALAAANQVTVDGNPQLLVQNLPPTSVPGAPVLTEPQIYYGQSMPGYVISNSKIPEIDYTTSTGNAYSTHYAGTGGVQLNSELAKFAFALRFSDLNILISSEVTSNSRFMYYRDIQTAAQTAAPFLTLANDPYAIIYKGGVDWVQDAYTTSADLPYGQAAQTSQVPATSGLSNGNFNYIRNSVKIVTNAYTGKMTFYVTDPSDPIIQAYEKAFPGMFTPMSAMPSIIRQHLRYPSDLFTVQSVMYGRYHIRDATNFYSAGNAWNLSEVPGNGSPSSALSQTVSTNAQGFATSSQTASMSPVYEMLQLPNATKPEFSLVDAFVPFSQNQVQQNLTGLMVAPSDPTNYGHLIDLVTPPGNQIDGPALINGRIQAQTAIAQQISLLDQHGSNVQQGQVMMIPLGQSLLYVRALYVESAQVTLPEVKDVIVVYGTQVAMEPTFAAALNDIFGVTVPGLSAQGASTVGSTPSSGSSGSTVSSGAAATVIQQAAALFTQAQAALKAGNLGTYQTDINQIGTLLTQAESASSTSTSTTSTSAGVTTTTAAKKG